MCAQKQLKHLLFRKSEAVLDNSKRGIEILFRLVVSPTSGEHDENKKIYVLINNLFISLLGLPYNPNSRKPLESDLKTILIFIIYRHFNISYSEIGSIFGYSKYLNSRIQTIYQLSKYRKLISVKDKQIINLTKKVIEELEKQQFPGLHNREKILYNVGLSSNKTGSEVSQGYF